MGFCNFYRQFIQDYSRIAAPLTRLTWANQEFLFDEGCIQAFETLRDRLMSVPLLAYYDLDSHYLLETDISNTVIAAVFSQKGLDRE